MSRQVWLSGRFLAEEEATIRATGPTLRSGIGLFETLRVAAGRAALLERHLERMRTSAALLGLPWEPFDAAGILAELAARNALPDAAGRIVLGTDHLLVECRPLPAGLAAERRTGVALPTTRSRWSPACHKLTARAALSLAERAAGGEAARMESGRRLLESTRSNLFAVTADGLETAAPPAVLPGIARALVVEISPELGIPLHPRAPRLDRAGRWREVFATNALRGVRPVVALGALRLPGPGPVTRALQKALDLRMGVR
jgi:branched-subunit amino acid aminotransferase/4-amino-4-deoxychorismate lyase